MAKEKKETLWKSFKEFIMKGNVFDLAVGIIIGGAFQSIVKSLVEDVIMPIITLFTGGIDFSNWYISLNGEIYENLAAAKEAQAATLNYGLFIMALINFVIMAVVVFAIVRFIGMFSKKKEEAPPPPTTTKECTYCKTEIHKDATRCPNCTSEVKKKS